MKKVSRIFIINLFLVFGCFMFAQELTTSNKNDIAAKYHTDAIRVSKNGLTKGKVAIKTNLLEIYKNHGSFVDIKSQYKISVGLNSNLAYEIESFQTENGNIFSNLIIWKKSNDLEQKIAEVSYEKSTGIEIPKALDKARKKWIELCSKNNSRKLVMQLYTENAIYFNRGRVLRGLSQLTKEYSYMDSPTYKLQLNPKHIEMVSEDIIYEIGECSGSYSLPYMLVWKKQSDGGWKIDFDSNY